MCMGVMYVFGHGVQENPETAYICFSISVANATGELYEEASSLRDVTAEALTPEQLKECKSIATEWRPKNKN